MTDNFVLYTFRPVKDKSFLGLETTRQWIRKMFYIENFSQLNVRFKQISQELRKEKVTGKNKTKGMRKVLKR